MPMDNCGAKGSFDSYQFQKLLVLYWRAGSTIYNL